MAVLIEGISVVVRLDAVKDRYPGGWDAFRLAVPNSTLCADNELARIGFMSPDDVKTYIGHLERQGLVYLKDGDAADIVIVDQLAGPTATCHWAEFGTTVMGNDKVAACRFKESLQNKVFCPEGWKFEKSLTRSYGFVPSEHVEKSLRFLRHEDGLDVYLNMLTGKEIYVGRNQR